jgi:predicted AAA+ superfamily ATPase
VDVGWWRQFGLIKYHKSFRINQFFEERIRVAAKHFKAVMLLGARQVGKSTLLKHILPEAECFVFDSI